jgi:hypothetical protein
LFVVFYLFAYGHLIQCLSNPCKRGGYRKAKRVGQIITTLIMRTGFTPGPGTRSRLFLLSFFFACVLFIPPHSPLIAQVSIQAGETYSENFDSLKSQSQAPLPLGWRASKLTSVRTPGSWQDAGTSTERIGGNNMSTLATNGIYNFGAGEASDAIDRSLGGISSGSASKSVNFYLALENTGEIAISSFIVSFDVKKFRQGTNPEGYRFGLYHSQDGNDWVQADDGFLAVFGPDAVNEGYASAPGEIKQLDSLVLNARIEPGDTLYLVWNYSVSKGSTTTNAQALAIDNVEITPQAAPWLEDLTVLPTDSFSAGDILNFCWRSYSKENTSLDWIDVSSGDTLFSEIILAGSLEREWIVPEDMPIGVYQVLLSTQRDTALAYASTPSFVIKELEPLVGLDKLEREPSGLVIRSLIGHQGVEIILPVASTSQASTRVVDAHGRVMISRNTSPGENLLIIDIEGLSPGLYLVIVESDGNRYSGKFLK